MTETDVTRGAIRKASWRILPLLGMGYLVAYMDRVNVSFAALQMNVDLGFSATVYGLGAGLFFLSYALFEVPSNVLLAKFGPRVWISRIMITWGLVATLMMFIRTPTHFYIMRFLLGMAEAGFMPAVIFYLSSWFPSRYRGRAITRYYAAAPVAGMLMGAIAGSLLSLDGVGRLHGWQWLFLITGLPAVAAGFVILRFLPESPATVPWLTKDESSWVQDELAREAAAIGEPPTHNVLAALANPVVLRLGLIGLLTIGANVTLTLSIPLLLKEQTGLSANVVGWLTSAGSFLAVAGILICGAICDRRGERFTVLLVSIAIVSAAYLTLALGLGNSTPVVIVTYLVWMFVYMFLSGSSIQLWPDLLHPRQLAVGGAAINTMCQIGGFVGPFAWGAARDASGSFHAGLYALVGATILAWLIAFSLARRTRGLRASLSQQQPQSLPSA